MASVTSLSRGGEGFTLRLGSWADGGQIGARRLVDDHGSVVGVNPPCRGVTVSEPTHHGWGKSLHVTVCDKRTHYKVDHTQPLTGKVQGRGRTPFFVIIQGRETTATRREHIIYGSQLY